MKRDLKIFGLLIIILSTVSLSTTVTACNAANKLPDNGVRILDLTEQADDTKIRNSLTDFTMVKSSFSLQSAEVNDTYVIQIGVPSNYNDTSIKYPVIYLTDANIYLMTQTVPILLDKLGHSSRKG
ncbi:MAG: hypothetical protein ACTSP4_16180 [Candidatus Hodarchaeales archaeon]